jgi:hypothetical protein
LALGAGVWAKKSFGSTAFKTGLFPFLAGDFFFVVAKSSSEKWKDMFLPASARCR